jgi:hypothetical protein
MMAIGYLPVSCLRRCHRNSRSDRTSHLQQTPRATPTPHSTTTRVRTALAVCWLALRLTNRNAKSTRMLTTRRIVALPFKSVRDRIV